MAIDTMYILSAGRFFSICYDNHVTINNLRVTEVNMSYSVRDRCYVYYFKAIATNKDIISEDLYQGNHLDAFAAPSASNCKIFNELGEFSAYISNLEITVDTVNTTGMYYSDSGSSSSFTPVSNEVFVSGCIAIEDIEYFSHNKGSIRERIEDCSIQSRFDILDL